MKLSVVVPFFNVENYIHDCLASIARQTMASFEVILVDDGSEDGSRAIAEEFCARDGRFRIVTQENQGLGPARNTGMRHAQGTYLTFVDSDDVIPQGAWRLMVDRLDASGSDFAAGDARRFSSDGMRESWTHIVPFARDRYAERIAEFPELANDRMIWNKVYRRSFWEQHGYEFPPIMYEDYPVTLRAYLEAEAVEVISDAVYYWRERDAGTQSITQRVFEPRNLADRVTSGLMVLGLLDDSVPPRVRETVHHHFLGTDVGAIARGVALAFGTSSYDAVLADAQRFVAALDPDVVATRSRFERLRVDLIRLGAGAALRHLIDVQDELEPPFGQVERAGGRRLIALQPAVAAQDPSFDALPADVRRLDGDDLRLETFVESALWEGPLLRLRVRSTITFGGPVSAANVRGWLVHQRTGTTYDLRTIGAPELDGHLVHTTLEVDGRNVLDASGDDFGSWVLNVELDTGDIVRSAPALGTTRGAPPFGAAWRAEEWRWVVPGRTEQGYVVRVVAPRARVTRVADGFGVELRLSGVAREPLPFQDTLVEVTSPAHTLFFPATADPVDPHRFDVHAQLGAIMDPEIHDELVPAARAYLAYLVAPGRREALLVDPGVPLGRFGHAGREVQVAGGRFLGAHVHESAPQFLLEEARVDGTLLTLAGRWVGQPAPEAEVALTWSPPEGLGEPVEVRLPVKAVDGFEVTVDAVDLVHRMRGVAVAGTGWWALALQTPSGRYAAHLSPLLVRELPLGVTTDGARVALTCHLELAARLTVTGL